MAIINLYYFNILGFTTYDNIIAISYKINTCIKYKARRFERLMWDGDNEFNHGQPR
jgi:hypothetical protein